MSGGLRDYQAWHRAYDDAASGLSWRLRTVQAAIATFLDERPGPVRVVSSCAGDGRDLIGALGDRDDRPLSGRSGTTAHVATSIREAGTEASIIVGAAGERRAVDSRAPGDRRVIRTDSWEAGPDH